MLLLAPLLACSATLLGNVVSSDGAAVEGAVLEADGVEEDCRAVSDPRGRFLTHCAQGTWTFRVTHPEHLPRTWEAPVTERGELELGEVRLERIPMEAGAFRLAEGGFASFDRAQLARRKEDGTQRWCVDRSGDAPIVLGKAEPVVVNGPDTWRLYALDKEGCALTLRRGSGEHWNLDATRVDLPLASPSAERPDLGEGRGWLDMGALPPGDYALVTWFGGFLVREDREADTWRGAWLQVGG